MGKILLNILDFPFQSRIVVDDSKSYHSTHRSSSIQVRRSRSHTVPMICGIRSRSWSKQIRGILDRRF
ncbi:hypothetical protein LINPERPRIM_LOCUS27961 [Linum perenne]